MRKGSKTMIPSPNMCKCATYEWSFSEARRVYHDTEIQYRHRHGLVHHPRCEYYSAWKEEYLDRDAEDFGALPLSLFSRARLALKHAFYLPFGRNDGGQGHD